MKPYSRTTVRKTKIHTASECGVCANGLDSNGVARAKLKLSLRKEVLEYDSRKEI